jgi:hypothetical protein
MYTKQSINSFGFYNTQFQDVHNRKRRQRDITEEGVVVNTLIKDGCDNNEDVYVKQTPLPQDMFTKQEKIGNKWLNNPIMPILAAPIVVMGIGVGLSAFYKKSMTSKYQLDKKMQLPGGGRVITINNDVALSLLSMVQDPSKETFHAAAIVIASAATAFIMKNTVDGVREVMVKKQAADIKRDKDEQLIDIETRSFAGKNQIIRSMISQKSTELSNYELANSPDPETDISFAQLKHKVGFKSGYNSNNKDNSDNQNNTARMLGYALIGAASLVASVICAKSILKNIRHVDDSIKEKAKEAAHGFVADVENLKTKEKLENELKNAKISEQAKDFVRKKWDSIHDPSKIDAPPKETNGIKTAFASFVPADSTSFIYTHLIHPNNQTATLAGVMCTAGAAGYLGQAAVKGVKDVQVEKANAKTEVELHDRLVQVELKNFYAKKNSYIKPIMDDTKEKLRNTPSKEERRKIKAAALAEIKNGPPYVYY